MLQKLKLRWQKWNNWRKYMNEGPIYKLLVLIGIIHSPSFRLWMVSKKENK